MDIQRIADLEAAMGRRISALPARLRPFTTEHGALPRALLLTGERGVVKTTFLLHHAKDRKMFYISAENPLLAAEPLYDVAKSIFLAGYKGIVIDEIHYGRDGRSMLKQSTTIFLNILSGSAIHQHSFRRQALQTFLADSFLFGCPCSRFENSCISKKASSIRFSIHFCRVNRYRCALHPIFWANSEPIEH